MQSMMKVKLAAVVILAGLVSGPGSVVGEPEFLTGYGHRKKITIDNTKVMGELTNFPVLLSITDADVKDGAKSDGTDIVITSADGTNKLSREIEKYDDSDGTLVLWFKAPILSNSVDTCFYLYYEEPTVAEVNDPATWDTNYVLVLHLDETGTSFENLGYDEHYDSTVYGNHGGWFKDGNNFGGGTMNTNGQIDGADLTLFHAINSNDEIRVADADSLDLNTNDLTLSLWMKYEAGMGHNGPEGGLISKQDNGVGEGFKFQIWGNNTPNIPYRLYWLHGGDREDISFPTSEVYVVDGDWHYVGMSVGRQPTESEITIAWADDVQKTAGTSKDGVNAYNVDGNNPLYITSQQYDSFAFPGFIDEVRISNIARGSNWISTCYNNQSAPPGFHTLAAEEDGPAPPESPNEFLAGWKCRKKITISKDVIKGGDLTNFPVLVSITDADIRAGAKPDGSDIVITSADGTNMLSREIEEYDDSDGTLALWFKAPVLWNFVDNCYYLYYSNPVAAEVNDPATWDSNYVCVLHLHETNTTFDSSDYADHYDSTVYSNHGGWFKDNKGFGGGTMDTNGKIAGGDFVALSAYQEADHIHIDDADSLDFNTNDFTVSLWARTQPGQGFGIKGAGYLITKTDSGVPTGWRFGQFNPGDEPYPLRTYYMTGGSSREEQTFSSNVVPIADDEWHYSGMSISRQPTSSEKLLYWRDGVVKERNTDFDGAAAINVDGSEDVYVGGVRFGGSESWHGFLDEIRISDISRHSNWIAMCYVNQSAPSSFVSLGAQESPPPGTLVIIR